MERERVAKRVNGRNSCSNSKKGERKSGGEVQRGNADTDGI